MEEHYRNSGLLTNNRCWYTIPQDSNGEGEIFKHPMEDGSFQTILQGNYCFVSSSEKVQ